MIMRTISSVLILTGFWSSAFGQHGDIHKVTPIQLSVVLAHYKSGKFADKPLRLSPDRDYWLSPDSRFLVVRYIMFRKTKQEATVVDYYVLEPKTARASSEVYDSRGLKEAHLFGPALEMIIRRKTNGSYLFNQGLDGTFIALMGKPAQYLGHSVAAPAHP